ncbi:hypothetical protein [Amycolatopsis magusensis]|uniref:hypothetical protein n=1 Tax=Amycolatopsis magusensis TaxID=882444 RepID=UPI0024A894CD|nr:hypothetical protein [Amycolatopsis magusensis]MDI5980105.1 hypothetical protein [Amycolatopsis magusensis]
MSGTQNPGGLPATLPNGRELLLCIDADCPGCGWAERWFSPARQLFGCSKCAYTSRERDA